MKLYLEEWLRLKNITPTELAERGVVSRRTIWRIIRCAREGKDTNAKNSLRLIAQELGILDEQLFRKPAPTKRYTLREWLRDGDPLIDTGRPASPQEIALASAMLEGWRANERALKPAARAIAIRATPHTAKRAVDNKKRG